MSTIDLSSLSESSPVPPAPVAPPASSEKSVPAFKVKKTPVIIPGIEGRITAELGPFLPRHQRVGEDGKVLEPSPYLEALIQMAKSGVLEVVNVAESQILWIGEGYSAPKPKPDTKLTVSREGVLEQLKIA